MLISWNGWLALPIFTDGSILAKQTGLGIEISDLEGPFLVTGQKTNQTDVNGFPSLKGFTGVQQVIPLNPDSIVEFSTIADKQNHDSKTEKQRKTLEFKCANH